MSLNNMSLFFPCTIETDPGRHSGWNRSTVQLSAWPDTGSNFQSGGSAEAAPSWHGGSEQWVQHPAGCQDSLGDGDRYVPPAAGGRGKRVSTHMALHVGLGVVSNLPLSNCFAVEKSHCPVLSHRIRAGCLSGWATEAAVEFWGGSPSLQMVSLWAGELGKVFTYQEHQ